MHSQSRFSLADKRVTVMGLGHFGGGAAAARYAAEQGARVTITDLANEESLRPVFDGLADVPFDRVRLGGHAVEDFQTADVVIVNPAVPPENGFLQIARNAGARLTSEIELFLEACPCRIIAVTGTNGKSTTAAMTAHVLNACGKTAWLGGNIGHSLLPDLDKISPNDWAVVELSSFQLEQLSRNGSYFSLMAVTNFTANHLERHGTLEAYAAAKCRMFDCAREKATLVMDTDDLSLCRWIRPSMEEKHIAIAPLIAPDLLPGLPVPGPHNRTNAAIAVTLACLAGTNEQNARDAVSSFSGLDHRLQPVPSATNRRCFDDSACTTPESAIAALEAIEGPAWLLVGGKDKGMNIQPLIEAVVGKAAGAACFGSVANDLFRHLRGRSPDFACAPFKTLAEAVAWAIVRSDEGDAILLSPGFASTDQFANYVERAAVFRRLVP